MTDLEKVYLTKEIKNIFVIGYFGHNNLGDESYKVTFDFIFQTFLPKNDLCIYNINYLDCDYIKLHDFNDSDIIILGGGDILNDYFLDKIILKFKNKPNKVIAVSVGIPYIDIVINTNKLNIIDYIFVRTKQDINLFKEYFHIHRIFYLPDISYYLLNLPKIILNNNTICNKTSKLLKNLAIIKRNKKIVCITLSQHIKEHNEHYNDIIQSIIQFVKYLLTFEYHIVFLPFNTNDTDKGYHENDILIHNDIVNSIKITNPNQIVNMTNIDFTIEPNSILQLYDYFYVTVPMRFHGTLFSIYKCVPMLPIFTTRKVKNLLLDINYDNFYVELKCDENDLPIYLDLKMLISKFGELSSNIEKIKNDLVVSNRDLFVRELKPIFENTSLCGTTNIPSLIDLITKDYSKINIVNANSTVESRISNAYTKALRLATDNGYEHFSDISNDHLKDVCVQIISHTLTNGTLNSIYNYGIKQKLFVKCNSLDKVTSEWKWVINDHTRKQYSTKKLYDNPYGLFNINYIDQVDYSSVHRSGWQYVYENINYLHNTKSDLYLDLYLDRTFHWNKQVNKFLNLIPYTKNWIGFIHHTFETGFSEYNCYNLIDNTDFIESLKVCKGIFVLSNDLKVKFQREFQKKNIHVPIFALVHPTEIKVDQWSFKSFIENNDKKIINVGAWLRNIFSFYNLNLPNKYTFVYKKNCWSKIKITDNMRKVCLKGGHMDNYFPSLNFTNQVGDFLVLQENNKFQVNVCGNCSQNVSQNACQNISQNICQNISQNISQNVSCNNKIDNNWYKHFHDYVKFSINSVDLLNQLSNDQYDDLLTKNIIFINLVDASAVNTIIECIVRSTPIIVNKHPAVVEMLGDKYPLYFTNGIDIYNTNKEIDELLSNTNNIEKANKYLQKLDKNKYKIEYFIEKFSKLINFCIKQ